MKNIKQTISTKIDNELMQKIDAEIQSLGFKSQSEFLRFSINNTLENLKNHEQTLTLIKEINEASKQNMNHVIRFFKGIHQENLDIKNSISEIADILKKISDDDPIGIHLEDAGDPLNTNNKPIGVPR